MITETKNTPRAHLAYINWKTVGANNFYQSSYHSGKDYFFNGEQINFEDYVGSLNLTGNELYRYPDLANALRALPEYPILTRAYKVDKKLTGVAFVEHFYATFKKGLTAFQTELAHASERFNSLVSWHGQKEQKPIISTIVYKERHQKRYIESVYINGVEWFLEASRSDRAENKPQIQRLDIAGLFGIDRSYCLDIEDCIENTALMAIRIRKRWDLKGQVVWYSLDTLSVVKLSDVRKHKKV